jgi:cytidylate kinase
MAVITVSRQMGSLGCEVANIVASKLGYHLVWRDLINQAAKLSGMPEMALAAIDELGLFGLSPSRQMCQAYRQAVKQVVLDLADQGNVIIVGRAGQAILAVRDDAVHVRLIASIELRAERIAQRQSISLECARAQIQASDQYRARYLRRCYGVRWDSSELYHLIINTGRFTPNQAASIICQTVSARFPDKSGINLPL